MTPSLSVSLVLQPPSLHNIPKNSVTRGVVNRSRRGTSSSLRSFPSSSSLSQIQPICYSITSSITHATTELLKSGSNMSSPAEISTLDTSSEDTSSNSPSSSVTSDSTHHTTGYHHAESNINGPNSALWKAISRVKQTITETPQLINSIAMSEYWSSLGFPQVQDNRHQKHIDPSSPMDLLHSKLVVNTTSIPFSTSPLGSSSSSPLSSPSLISSPTYFNNMNHDYFNGGVSAGDTTPALSPSSVKFSSGPNSSSEHLPLTQPANNEKRQISKPKFFICDDSDSDSDTYVDEKHEFTADTLHGNIMILSTDQILEESQHYGDCEDFDSSDDLSDTEDQDCLFGKKSPSFYSLSKCSETDSNSVPSPQCAFMGRRQSLLSDLLMAEKKQKSRTFQALSSTCHSSPNSDGESAAVHMASNPMSQIYPSNPQQHQRCEYNTSHGNTTHFNASIGRGRDRNDWTTNECQDSIKVSPLTRTKKVYKNLAEMGKLSFPTLPENSASLSISPCAAKVSTSPTATTSTTAATTTIMTASSINTSSSTSTSTSSNSTCKSSTSTRSRSRIQVQGQIQSLVAHSTSTAHRAFLSASATLTDVLFRTSQ